MSLIINTGKPATSLPPGGLDLNTVASTDWRLVFEEVLGANIWLGQVQLRETVGGANVAIHGTTGTASSPSTINTGYEPSKAFDGASPDGWYTGITGVGGGILQFTFATPRNIKQVALKSPASATTSDMKRMVIQCLVGSEWVNMAMHTNDTQFGLSETRLYSALVTSVFDVFVGDVFG